MAKIIYVPLENLEQRYTVMMNKAIQPYVDIILYPDLKLDAVIKRGQFLDIVNTCKFKAAQLQMIAELFDEGKIESGDSFLVADIFFPGIESIKYMAELQDLDVKVFGFNYAGRADKTDFVQKLYGWADYSEAGYHLICDGVFVGSLDHKKNVCEYFGLNTATVYATGLVWDLNYMDSYAKQIGNTPKEDFIIWPHRWCDEKGIDDLKWFAAHTKKKIVITSSGPEKNLGWYLPSNVEYKANLTKLEYYTLMSKARWYLGTQKQETFGYSIQEAIYFGCEILVPDTACCAEMVPPKNVYKTILEIDSRFDHENLVVDLCYTKKWDDNTKEIINIIKNV